MTKKKKNIPTDSLCKEIYDFFGAIDYRRLEILCKIYKYSDPGEYIRKENVDHIEYLENNSLYVRSSFVSRRVNFHTPKNIIIDTLKQINLRFIIGYEQYLC